MGINGFKDLLKKGEQFCKTPMYYSGNVNELSQKTLAIDMMCYIYQIISRATKKAIVSFDEPDIIPFLEHETKQWFSRFNSVDLICCWDGPNKPMKEQTQKERRLKEDVTRQNVEIAKSQNDFASYIRYRSQLLRPTKEMIEVVKGSIEELGYTNMDAEGEGEFLCCRLQREGKAFAVISKDYDCFAFGADLIIRELKDNGHCKIYVRDTVVRSIFPYISDRLICYQAFYTLCCLIGNDFIDRVYMRGPAKVSKLINKHALAVDGSKPYELLQRCVMDPEQKSVVSFDKYKKVYDLFVSC